MATVGKQPLLPILRPMRPIAKSQHDIGRFGPVVAPYSSAPVGRNDFWYAIRMPGQDAT
jgi:hypothetical protein